MQVVLLSSNISNSGGTERIGIALANELSLKPDIQVSIFSLYGSINTFFEVDSKIKIEILLKENTKLKFSFISVICKLRKKIKKLNQNAIIINIGSLLGPFCIIANIFLKRKLIVWEHFNSSLSLKNKKEKLARLIAVKYADMIVTLTMEDLKIYNQLFNTSSKVKCIPNFLPFEQKWKSPLSSKVALSIGRFTEQKGFDRLILIWSKIAKIVSDWKLYIVGGGEQFQELDDMIKKLNMEESIFLAPLTSNVDYYYREASLYLMTSRWEGLPMVLIEAQSYGLPIIAYDCLTGPKDIVTNGVDGFIIKDGCESDYVKMATSLMNNREDIKSFGQASLRSGLRFDKNVILEEWLNLFSTINKDF